MAGTTEPKGLASRDERPRGHRSAIRIGLAVALVALAALPSSVGAVPPPASYDVTCAVGGDTVATWSHARVTDVLFTWLDSTDQPPNVGTANLSAHGRHGKVSFATPGPAAYVNVQIYLYGGGEEDRFNVACS